MRGGAQEKKLIMPTDDSSDAPAQLDGLIDEFNALDLDVSGADTYLAVSDLLRRESKSAHERGAAQLGHALGLLQAICDLTHSPDNSAQPFGQMVVLTVDEITVLEGLLDHVRAPLVKGRLADVLWIQSQPRKHEFALAAIDAYIEVPITSDSWFGHQGDNWHRAAVLCRLLGQVAADRELQLERSLLDVVANAKTEDKYLAAGVADVLDAQGLGKSEAQNIAAQLEALAHQFAGARDFTRCFDYYQEAAKWFDRAGENQKAIEMTIAQAESCVMDAEAILESDDSSHMNAAIFVENAVQILRTVPRASRTTLDIDKRIRELRLRLAQYNQEAVNELKTVSFESNITKLVNKARDAVKGRSLLGALEAFGRLSPFRVHDLQRQASEIIEESPLHVLLPRITYSGDGRVSHVSPGLTIGDPDSREQAVKDQMLRLYGQAYVAGSVTISIRPALEVLHLEHRIREQDFFTLTRKSPIVPIGRERLFAKALWSGYCGDYATAVHLLTSQMEHLVRSRLKSARVVTTLLDPTGVGTEKSLNALMDMQETEDLFEPDLAFEIRAIFCESLGGNLRNDVAHGLLDDQESQGYWSVYAWWLVLKLVFGSYRDALIASRQAADLEAESANADDAPSSDGK